MRKKISTSKPLRLIPLALAFLLMTLGTSVHAEVSPVRSYAPTTNAVQVVIENAGQNHESDYEKLAERLDKMSEKAESYYEKRYEELKATHDRFMVAVEVCLVVFTLFGVLLPFAVAILQHRNFDNAIGVAKEKIDMEFGDKIKEAIFQAQIGSISAMEISVSQEIERMFDCHLNTNEEKMRCIFNLAAIIQTLHLIFEGAMRTKRRQVIVNEIEKYQNFVSRWVDGENAERKEVWHRAEGVMKRSVSRDASAVTRNDYVELLGEHSEAFLWLEDFYARIAPWKFEEEK